MSDQGIPQSPEVCREIDRRDRHVDGRVRIAAELHELWMRDPDTDGRDFTSPAHLNRWAVDRLLAMGDGGHDLEAQRIADGVLALTNRDPCQYPCPIGDMDITGQLVFRNRPAGRT